MTLNRDPAPVPAPHDPHSTRHPRSQQDGRTTVLNSHLPSTSTRQQHFQKRITRTADCANVMDPHAKMVGLWVGVVWDSYSDLLFSRTTTGGLITK